MLLASKEENKKILKVNSMPTITSTPPCSSSGILISSCTA